MTKSANELAPAIIKLYIALLSLAVIYAYVAIGQADYEDAFQKLQAIDGLLIVKTITAPHHSSDELPSEDIPDFFPKAPLSNSEVTGASSVPIRAARLGVPLRMHAGDHCEVALLPSLSGGRLNFPELHSLGNPHWVNSEDITIASFGQCIMPFIRGFNLIIIHLQSDIVVAVPADFVKSFPGLLGTPFEDHFDLAHIPEIKSHLPAPFAENAEFVDDYIMFHVKNIDSYILKYANKRHRRFYGPDEVESAITNLYQERERVESFFGVQADGSRILLLGPLVSFVLAWELWRRVRRISTSKIGSELFWFASDTDDLLGIIGSQVYSLTPLVIGVVVTGIFVDSVFVHKSVDLAEVSTDEFVGSYSKSLFFASWFSYTTLSSLSLIAVGLQFLMLANSSARLAQISDSLRKAASGSLPHKRFWQLQRLVKTKRE